MRSWGHRERRARVQGARGPPARFIKPVLVRALRAGPGLVGSQQVPQCSCRGPVQPSPGRCAVQTSTCPLCHGACSLACWVLESRPLLVEWVVPSHQSDVHSTLVRCMLALQSDPHPSPCTPSHTHKSGPRCRGRLRCAAACGSRACTAGGAGAAPPGADGCAAGAEVKAGRGTPGLPGWGVPVACSRCQPHSTSPSSMFYTN
jgi:hypothetical protein